jgi:hypothetical protein
MDEATRDLLGAISQALEGSTDQRAALVRSAVHQVLGGQDRANVAAWLRAAAKHQGQQGSGPE